MAFLGVIIVAALPREDEEDVRREEKTREDVVVGAIVVAKEQAANMVLRCFLFLDIMERICFLREVKVVVGQFLEREKNSELKRASRLRDQPKDSASKS
jgi:hypothetical protein